jgi:HD-GYP domain-containing protein (c-di-GMP phosphodiesterase class II)
MVDEVIADEAFESLVTRSNGTVVQHMSRVFMNGTAFLLHYNRSVLTTGLVSAIRARFVGRYKKRYRQLLPHVHDDHLSLERVFMGGMRALSPDELHNITLGFLLHDVGKVDDIEYHEGEAGYDRDTVERHVKRGYQAVMNKTTYPREAGLITGYHHEYYGDPSGYGYFRELLGRYRRENPDAAAEYCIAYALEPIVDYQALAFFGAKVLEIVDVYDALTDKNRRYRSPMSSDDALHLMRTQFLDEHLKLDPILFEIYDQYVRA